ncbi:MAG: hypothetical protein ACRERD_29265 [Candidatus Binatia bacterium]
MLEEEYDLSVVVRTTWSFDPQAIPAIVTIVATSMSFFIVSSPLLCPAASRPSAG